MAYGYVDPNANRNQYSGALDPRLQRQSDFFKGQTYTNPYADFTKTAMGNAAATPYADFIKKAYGSQAQANATSAAYNAKQPADPFGAEGVLGSKDAFGNAFGYSGYGDINSPWSQGQLRTHMANLAGGEQNAIDQYTKNAANAGVTAGRGGFGVTGGASPEAQLQQNAMRTLGNIYGQNYGQSMEYLKSSADSMDRQAAAMANLYGNLYNTNAQTGLGYANLGLGYSNQALQGLTNQGQQQLGWGQLGFQGTAGDAAAQKDWNDKMLNAYQQDVNLANQQTLSAPDREFQQWQRQQAQMNAQDQRSRADYGRMMLEAYSNPDKTTGMPDYQFISNMAPLWRSDAGLPFMPQAGAQPAGKLGVRSNPYGGGGIAPEQYYGRNAYTY